jgi:uncharacterized glyoxalase superfamily protein PhnB
VQIKSSIAMNKAASPIPEGFSTITPYFAVPEADKLLDFLTQAFDAEVLHRHMGPNGKIAHAALRIGSSTLMLGGLPPGRTPLLAMLYFYVADCDATYRRAISAGARSVLEPKDMYYGDRSAAVDDPVGNQWWIATHKEDLSEAELEARMKQNLPNL